jgi:hypothetical protein
VLELKMNPAAPASGALSPGLPIATTGPTALSPSTSFCSSVRYMALPTSCGLLIKDSRIVASREVR